MDKRQLIPKNLISKLAIILTATLLFSCSNQVLGNINNSQKTEGLSAFYISLNDDKPIYTLLDTDSENAISTHVYGKFLNTLRYIDNLNHLYDIEWAKDYHDPKDYLSFPTIDTLCVGNIFLQRYHDFGKKKYGSQGHEDMYHKSLSHQPTYISILEKELKAAQDIGMASSTNIQCLKMLAEDNNLINTAKNQTTLII